MTKKRSQAALEFIMTYGWAILVVLISIFALSYFGVLNPDRFLPSKCVFPSGIACLDFRAVDPETGPGNITLVVKNGFGYLASAASFSATSCTTPSTPVSSWQTGQQISMVAIGCSITKGSFYQGDINVTYTVQDTGLPHTKVGKLSVRVQ